MTLPDLNIDPRRIPIIGEDIYQVGQIYDIVDQTCAPDPVIAVNAMFYYAPTLVWSLLKPEALDLTYDRFRRTHKRKRYGKVRKPSVTQLGLIDNAKVPRWAVFAGELAQRLGWYLIVADATTDWAVNWTSMAYTYSGCNGPVEASARLWGDAPLPIEPWAPQPWLTAGFNHSSTGQGGSSISHAFVNHQGTYSVTFSAEIFTIGFGGAIGSVDRVVVYLDNDPGTDEALEAVQTKVAGQPDRWETAAQIYGHIPHRTTASILVWWSSGAMACTNVNLQLLASTGQGIFPDP